MHATTTRTYVVYYICTALAKKPTAAFGRLARATEKHGYIICDTRAAAATAASVGKGTRDWGHGTGRRGASFVITTYVNAIRPCATRHDSECAARRRATGGRDGGAPCSVAMTIRRKIYLYTRIIILRVCIRAEDAKLMSKGPSHGVLEVQCGRQDGTAAAVRSPVWRFLFLCSSTARHRHFHSMDNNNNNNVYFLSSSQPPIAVSTRFLLHVQRNPKA